MHATPAQRRPRIRRSTGPKSTWPKSVRFLLSLWSLSLLCLSGVAVHAADGEPDPEGVQFFESKIRPLLLNRCAECHGAETQESGLRLDTYSGMMTGGTAGPVLNPGTPDESLLIAAVSYKDDALQMPPDGKLSDTEINDLKEWIARGAPHPEQGQAMAAAPRRGAINLEEERNHWAFRPVVRPEIPESDGNGWVRTPIDAFIYKAYQEHQLQPVPPADKRTLIRRATYDLTGLPPTPEEIDAFLADESPDAFEKVVDRLLASPEYGERWGRHWLNVVRYADSNGQDENLAFVDAWRYRDYVIRSFNNDKPYSQFLLEQIAGDLIVAQQSGATSSNALPEIGEESFDLLIATGFLALGPKVLAEQDLVKKEMDIIDEQVSTLGQAVLGLTLGCARCHDHKFDPIYIDDYYRLAGIFKSTTTLRSLKTNDICHEYIVATPAEREARRLRDEEIQRKQDEIDATIKAANAELAKNSESGEVPKEPEKLYPEETKAALATLREELKTLKENNAELPTCMGVTEGTPTDLRIHVRGSHLTLGKSVTRGIPAVLEFNGNIEIPDNTSGRLELAQWITDPQHPLTPRVAVNRIWRWHFGTGIVPTTDNFGKLGGVPSNPELLDWLAAEFVDSGWSFKAMHKKIMLSNVYQLGSTQNDANAAIDPENQFFWRSNVRRLEAEEIRDSLLAVSGLLDNTRGGSLLNIKKGSLIFDHTSKDGTTYDTFRRSVYLPVVRNNLYDLFALFDYSDADIPASGRETSTVAPQALYLMNSPLMLQISAATANRLLGEHSEDHHRINRLYELAYGRPATHTERERFLNYLSRFQESFREYGNEPDPRLSAWAVVIQGILSSNEFFYLN